jgi:flagellar basal body rod protein FlgG
MNRGLEALVSGGMAALARLDAATQNLANVGTAGYKGERAVFELQGLPGTYELATGRVLQGIAAEVAQVATVRDFSPGPIRPTGNPLDVAIDGPGFFVVATTRGERYTRQGAFSVDGEGNLVTLGGERVQGEGGDIRAGTGNASVTEDGSVVADGLVVGRLRLVELGDPPRLVPEGAALFAAEPGAAPAPLDQARVRLAPGALEGANVDAVASLIELIDVARGYESYMHALRRLDGLSERSINELGRV